MLERFEFVQVRLPAGIGLKLAGLLRQSRQQRRGQQIQTQTVIADSIGQMGQFVQALAQAVAQGQPVLLAKLEEAPGAGFEQLQKLAQLQHAAIVQLHFAVEHEPVTLLLEPELELAHARPRLDPHALAFRPDTLQPVALQRLQFTQYLQGILRLGQLPLLTIGVGLGKCRAGLQHPLQRGGFRVQVTTGLQRFTVQLTEHVLQPMAGLEPAAAGQRPHQQLQTQAGLQRQQVGIQGAVGGDAVEMTGQFGQVRVDRQQWRYRTDGLDQLRLGRLRHAQAIADYVGDLAQLTADRINQQTRRRLLVQQHTGTALHTIWLEFEVDLRAL
ncbi:hypothetical protein D3C86_1093370 [compost metagenome]